MPSDEDVNGQAADIEIGEKRNNYPLEPGVAPLCARNQFENRRRLFVVPRLVFWPGAQARPPKGVFANSTTFSEDISTINMRRAAHRSSARRFSMSYRCLS